MRAPVRHSATDSLARNEAVGLVDMIFDASVAVGPRFLCFELVYVLHIRSYSTSSFLFYNLCLSVYPEKGQRLIRSFMDRTELSASSIYFHPLRDHLAQSIEKEISSSRFQDALDVAAIDQLVELCVAVTAIAKPRIEASIAKRGSEEIKTLFVDGATRLGVSRLCSLMGIEFDPSTSAIESVLSRLLKLRLELSRLSTEGVTALDALSSEWRRYRNFCSSMLRIDRHRELEFGGFSPSRFMDLCVTFDNLFSNHMWLCIPLDARRRVSFPMLLKTGQAVYKHHLASRTGEMEEEGGGGGDIIVEEAYGEPGCSAKMDVEDDAKRQAICNLNPRLCVSFFGKACGAVVAKTVVASLYRLAITQTEEANWEWIELEEEINKEKEALIALDDCWKWSPPTSLASTADGCRIDEKKLLENLKSATIDIEAVHRKHQPTEEATRLATLQSLEKNHKDARIDGKKTTESKDYHRKVAIACFVASVKRLDAKLQSLDRPFEKWMLLAGKKDCREVQKTLLTLQDRRDNMLQALREARVKALDQLRGFSEKESTTYIEEKRGAVYRPVLWARALALYQRERRIPVSLPSPLDVASSASSRSPSSARSLSTESERKVFSRRGGAIETGELTIELPPGPEDARLQDEWKEIQRREEEEIKALDGSRSLKQSLRTHTLFEEILTEVRKCKSNNKHEKDPVPSFRARVETTEKEIKEIEEQVKNEKFCWKAAEKESESYKRPPGSSEEESCRTTFHCFFDSLRTKWLIPMLSRLRTRISDIRTSSIRAHLTELADNVATLCEEVIRTGDLASAIRFLGSVCETHFWHTRMNRMPSSSSRP